MPQPPSPPAAPPPEAELPPLRDVIARHGLDARKALGQHFLLDLNLTRRIARAAGDLAAHEIVEIGGGPGGLTRALLLEGARRVTVVERDPRAVAALGELAAAFPGRLAIVEGDALAIDPAALVAAPRKIVANLPYNIATPLLIGWLRNIAAYAGLTLMFQKEVAERIVAPPRSPHYGRLAVITQTVATARLLFDIPARAFVPPPRIVSTVVEIGARSPPLAPPSLAAAPLEVLERVTAAAFGQRRKMLRSSLRSLGLDVEALLAAARIDPTRRAEELDVEEFGALAAAAASMRRSAAG